jgi:ribosome recycling factor
MNSMIEEFKKQCGAVLDGLKKELSGIRTNRPNVALVEDLRVNYYDQQMPVKQVGSISIEPPRQIIIQVWDKGAVSGVVKAIDSANLGLSANVDGNLIRVSLPELNQERREELVKHVKKTAEQYRIQIRHARDEMNKRVQKAMDDGEVSEDQKFKLKEEVQKQTDKTNEDVEKTLDSKIKEINE